MRHATERAFLTVLTRAAQRAGGMSSRCACGAPRRWEVHPAEETEFYDEEAEVLLGLVSVLASERIVLPNCPKCRVLIDAALEGKDLRAVLARATS